MADVLDIQDRAILDVLLRDARTPIAQISEQIGLSRPAVAERIEKLERRGIFCGTTAVINPPAIGLGVTAFVSARQTTAPDSKAKAAWSGLLARDEVLEAHTVAGEDCYLLKVRTDTIASLNSLVRELSTAPLSLATRTTIVLESHCEKVGGIRLPVEVRDEA